MSIVAPAPLIAVPLLCWRRDVAGVRDPKTAFVFKHIFGAEDRKHLLIGLRNALLELDGAFALLTAFSEWHAIALATRALVHVARGEHADARSVVDRAVLLMRIQSGFEEGEALIRLAELEVLEAAGDLPAAHRAAALAIARLEERAQNLVEPWRTRFLARAVHAQTLSRRARAAS